jgi:hypothetical protein
MNVLFLRDLACGRPPIGRVELLVICPGPRQRDSPAAKRASYGCWLAAAGLGLQGAGGFPCTNLHLDSQFAHLSGRATGRATALPNLRIGRLGRVVLCGTRIVGLLLQWPVRGTAGPEWKAKRGMQLWAR